MSNIDKRAVQAVADLKAGYTLGHADVAMLNELARIALASLEAEPVAYIGKIMLEDLTDGARSCGRVWPDLTDKMSGEDRIPLFLAPQTTVSVPDMATPQSMRAMFCHLDDSECAIAADVWNACRAAMLQGAENVESPTTMHTAPALDSSPKIAESTSGNSPVIPDGLRLALSNAGIAAPESDEMLAATCEKYIQSLVTWVKDRKPFRSAVIPDSWVACSERMPEVGVKVLCFPVNDEPIHATYNGQVWLQDISWSTSDEPIDNVISCNVFHWMPLPAAPQQEGL